MIFKYLKRWELHYLTSSYGEVPPEYFWTRRGMLQYLNDQGYDTFLLFFKDRWLDRKYVSTID